MSQPTSTNLDDAKGAPARSPLGDFLVHFFRNRTAVIGLIITLLLAGFAATGFYFTFGDSPSERIFDPLETQLKHQLLPPVSEYTVEIEQEDGSIVKDTKTAWLGTDELGRDVLRRLWSGSTYSMLVGFVVVGISALIGILVGGIAGFYGRGRAGLPFMITVIGPPIALLVFSITDLGGFAQILGWLILAVVAAFVLLQIYCAVRTKRALAVVLFFLGVLGAVFTFGYPSARMSVGAYGDLYYAAGDALSDNDAMIAGVSNAIVAANEHDRLLGRKRTLGEEFTEISALEEAAASLTAELYDVSLEQSQYEASTQFAKAAKAGADISDKEREIERLTNEGVAKNQENIDKTKAAIEALKKAQTAANSAAEKALENYEKAESNGLETFQPVGGVLPDKYVLLRQRAALRTQAKQFASFREQSIKTVRKDDPVLDFVQAVWFMIVVGFLAVLAFMVLAKAAQDGAEEVNKERFFLPIMTIDNFVMRLIEILGTVPRLFLLLTVLAIYEKNVLTVMFVLGVTSWMGTARFVRAEILSLRERDFIQATRALGLNDFRIIVRHLVPNSLSPVLVSMTIGVATAILFESTLSFLSIGAGPEEVTWGKMLSDGRGFITSAWWLTVIPGVAIFVVVLAFNLLGEGLREAMNPKLRKR